MAGTHSLHHLQTMRQNNLFATLSFLIVLAMGAILADVRYQVADHLEAGVIGVVASIAALVVSSVIQVAEPGKKPAAETTLAREISEDLKPKTLAP